MTRRDQKLLDKQFRQLNQSGGLLALSVVSTILIFVVLGSAVVA